MIHCYPQSLGFGRNAMTATRAQRFQISLESACDLASTYCYDLCVSSLVATFHRQQSGVKEPGCSILISEHLLIPEGMPFQLILHRPLCDELEYDQEQRRHSHRLTSRCVDDRHAMYRVVCHSFVERRTSISILCRIPAPWVDCCLGSRCVRQPCVCSLILTSCG